MEKDIKPLQFDWKIFKEIVCGMANALYLLCEGMPEGNIQKIVCGLAGILLWICNKIPG